MMISSKHLRERIGLQANIAERNCTWYRNVLFAYLEMFLSNIFYKLSNISNLEVRWKFLFQEPALTGVFLIKKTLQ